VRKPEGVDCWGYGKPVKPDAFVTHSFVVPQNVVQLRRERDDIRKSFRGESRVPSCSRISIPLRQPTYLPQTTLNWTGFCQASSVKIEEEVMGHLPQRAMINRVISDRGLGSTLLGYQPFNVGWPHVSIKLLLTVAGQSVTEMRRHVPCLIQIAPAHRTCKSTLMEESFDSEVREVCSLQCFAVLSFWPTSKRGNVYACVL